MLGSGYPLYLWFGGKLPPPPPDVPNVGSMGRRGSLSGMPGVGDRVGSREGSPDGGLRGEWEGICTASLCFPFALVVSTGGVWYSLSVPPCECTLQCSNLLSNDDMSLATESLFAFSISLSLDSNTLDRSSP